LPDDPIRTLLILDSDHTKDHVLRELEAYVPILEPGDYLVVEDTCINGHPVREDFGPGPYEAVEEYLANNPAYLLADDSRNEKFGVTQAPDGYFIRT
jgi:cephalosporin hydroxylase